MLSLHDRIGGTPAIVSVLDKFLNYVDQHSNVWFARKDEIAEWTLNNNLFV